MHEKYYLGDIRDQEATISFYASNSKIEKSIADPDTANLFVVAEFLVILEFGISRTLQQHAQLSVSALKAM